MERDRCAQIPSWHQPQLLASRVEILQLGPREFPRIKKRPAGSTPAGPSRSFEQRGSSMNTTRVSLSLVIGLAFAVVSSLTVSAIVHPPDVNPAYFNPVQAIDNNYFL